MQIDPHPEAVHVTVFMEGLRPGPSEVFCVHPTMFEEAVYIEHSAYYNFKLSKLSWNG